MSMHKAHIKISCKLLITATSEKFEIAVSFNEHKQSVMKTLSVTGIFKTIQQDRGALLSRIPG